MKKIINYSILLTFISLVVQCSGKFKSLQLGVDLPQGTMENGITVKIRESNLEFYNTNGLVIALPVKHAFLSGARAKSEIGYSMATFTMGESKEYNCSVQSIRSADLLKDRYIISGTLEGDNDCPRGNYTIELVTQADQSLDLNIKLPEGFNRLYFKHNSDPVEAIFGLGEQFTHLNQKGHRVPMLTEEQGIGRGAQPITLGANITAGAGGTEYSTYTPVPFYVTSAYRSFALENTAYSVFDFTCDRHIVIEIWDTTLTAKVDRNVSPANAISKYTAMSGRFEKLPSWAYGTILGTQGGRNKVEAEINAALAAGNPVTAIWIQDWVGRRKTSFGSQLWWRWLPDEEAYPDFKNWTSELKKKNIVTLGYINSFLADSGPMFEEAVAKGYLVKNAEGKDYEIKTAGFPAYLVDLTNPAAFAWLKEVIKKNMIGNGLGGWMADFGEWLPFDAKLHSGEDAAIYHNRYPVDWARLNREAIREAGKEGEIVFFTRAGFTESAKYSTLFWAGDQMVEWDQYDGLASSITGIITGGLSGIALNHSDIGGYTTINNPIRNYHRSKELFQRWSEANVFSPFFRTHEGNRPEKNHQHYSDPDTVDFFARMGRLHYAIKDYIQETVEVASESGLPVMRAVWMHYPNDEQTYHARHQYMLGDTMLVLPVIHAGAKHVRGYVPAGNWEHPLGMKYNGPGYFSIGAPISCPAVLLRMDSERYPSLRDTLRESYLKECKPKE
ncbi:MAG: alpha-glucosidase [Leptospiraceae bacterium]|nr:alpha-glucosidase [Leptospiraceae bacterium]